MLQKCNQHLRKKHYGLPPLPQRVSGKVAATFPHPLTPYAASGYGHEYVTRSAHKERRGPRETVVRESSRISKKPVPLSAIPRDAAR